MKMKKALCAFICAAIAFTALPLRAYAEDISEAPSSFTQQNLEEIEAVDVTVKTLMESTEFERAWVEPFESFTVYGYESTAGEHYAEANGFTFVSLDGNGDINGDGRLSMADTVSMQKYILGKSEFSRSALARADICRDGRVNCFDMAIIKKILLEAQDSLDYKIELNQHFDCNFETEDNDAVITSADEMTAFLDDYVSEEALNETYLAKYNDAFFEENVLLLRAIFQSCGGSICYDINNVDADGNVLTVTFCDMYEENQAFEDVCSEVIAQVIIPKEDFIFEDVVWECLVIN